MRRFFGSRFFSSSATAGAAAPASPSTIASYSRALAGWHWAMAGGVLLMTGTAYVAGGIDTDPLKSTPEQLKRRGQLMFLHESVGLLLLGAFLPRVVSRLTSRIPSALPVPGWQRAASTVTHTALYGALAFMPISGLAFGYLSGWGVPFFFVNPAPFTAAPKEEIELNKESYGKWEKFFYENHHRVGNLLYYIIPLHIGGTLFNTFFRGTNMFRRMSIFKQ
jgi:cytochrome b561